MTEPADLTIFLHLTKTAGGTLKEALIRSGKPGLFTNSETEAENVADDCDFIFGHLKWGLNMPSHRQPKYMTLVRHPFNRVVSHFYQLSHVDVSRRGEETRRFRSIDHFFETSNHWEFSNFMSRIMTDTAYDTLEDEDLFARAKEIVDRDFSFIGLYEHFPTSLFMLSHLLGAKLAPNRNFNVGSYDPYKISAKTIDTIMERNQVDLRLYHYCAERFLDQTANMGRIVEAHALPHVPLLTRARQGFRNFRRYK